MWPPTVVGTDEVMMVAGKVTDKTKKKVVVVGTQFKWKASHEQGLGLLCCIPLNAELEELFTTT